MSNPFSNILEHIAKGDSVKYIFAVVCSGLTCIYLLFSENFSLMSTLAGTGVGENVIIFLVLMDFVVALGAYSLLIKAVGGIMVHFSCLYNDRRLAKRNNQLVYSFRKVAPSLNVHHTNTLYSLLESSALPAYILRQLEDLVRLNFVVKQYDYLYVINPVLREEVAVYLNSIGKRSLEAAL